MRKLYFFLSLYCFFTLNVFGQANPFPVSLPFNFTSQTGSVLPAGVALHRFGITAGSIPLTRILTPGNADLTYAAGATSGGWRDEGANGIGILASGSNAAGAMIVSINTLGQSNIQVSWLCRTILQQASRDNSIALQYRIGRTGNFTDIGTTTTYTSQGNAAGHVSGLLSETLPVAAENQPEVQIRWIYWESNGSSGSRDRIAVDDISITAGSSIPTAYIGFGSTAGEPTSNGSMSITLNPSTISSATVDFAFSGTASFGTDYTVTVTGAAPNNPGAATGTFTIAPSTQLITVTIIPTDDGLAEGTETVTLTLSNISGGYIFNTSALSINLTDDDLPTNIAVIQGTGAAANAGIYGIDAIVTGVYPSWSPAGFYVQQSDATADADPLTSNGIFIVSSTVVNIGDRVAIVGAVQENGSTPSFNQAVMIPSSVNITSSGNPLPSVTDISLPVTAVTDFERYEGMLVRFNYVMTVTGNLDLGRFGELSLSRNGPVYQPTQIIDPNDNPASGTTSTGNSNVPAVTTYTTDNLLRTILLDDGRSTIPTLPFVDANNTVRLGSTINGLNGIMGFGFSNYRIMPFNASHPLGAPAFTYAARPLTPPSVGSAPNLKIASFNVENFFNGDGSGGGFPTSRGADSFAEYIRQRGKLVEALFLLNADIVGLVEIENDGTGANSAIAQLVDALNTRAGTPGLYTFIIDAAQPPTPTGDEIRSTIIYKPSVVTTVGAPMIDLNPVHNRPPTAQTFNLTSVNKDFTFIVNHLRAKGCSGSSTGLNADQGDGQACNTEFRRQQANAILSFINTTVIPTSGNNRIITVGDYNAYYEEDPIDIFRAAGYIVLGNNTDVSYTFTGQQGTLKHVIISPSLLSSFTGIAKWNINSFEPSYFGYDDNIQDASETTADVNPWFALGTGLPFRISDHDPVITGFLFTSTLPLEWGVFNVTKAGTSSNISWSTLQETNTDYFIVERSTDGRNWSSITSIKAAGNSSSEINYSFTDALPVKGRNFYRIRQFDLDGKSKTTDIKSLVFTDFKNISFFPNPATDRITLQSSASKILTVRIVDAEGRTLIQQNVNQTTVSVDVKALKPGMYLLQIVNNDGIQTEKFVKQ
ncbi:MAG: ExeM/NucH family extracellular endonuclease [Chitinophagaceae bacterium]|nr:ExeM/NucH family extracellular endonuclease [Chitinophagaceae bacterium]